MMVNRSWINSKSFLIRPILFSLFCFFAFSCSSDKKVTPPLEKKTKQVSADQERHDEDKKVLQIAPWEIWAGMEVADSDLKEAEELAQQGKWRESQDIYSKVINNNKGQVLAEDAFIRKISLALKQGQSKFALDEIGKHLKENNQTLQQISPILALMAAFSYLHLSNDNQFFAWIKSALSITQAKGEVASIAKDNAKIYLSTLRDDSFKDLFYQWSTDEELSRLFLEESERRKSGGAIAQIDYKKWFKIETYLSNMQGLRESDLAMNEGSLLDPSKFLISVILPQSGQFAKPAENIKRGIELAVSKTIIADKVQLNFLDSRGDAELVADLYVKEAKEKKSEVVLGPLLSKEAEKIAEKSREVNLPFITFTKKEEITDLSPVCFRLGFTIKDQAEEMINYIVNQLKLTNILLLKVAFSENSDILEAIKKAAMKKSLNVVVREFNKDSNDPSELLSGIDANYLAVFVDNIEQSLAAINAIKSSAFSEMKIMGTAMWEDTAAIRAYSSLLEGSFIVSSFVINSSRKEVVNFISEYKQAYGEAPDMLAAQSYDATKLILQGLEKAQDATIEEIRKNILNNLYAINSYSAVTGIITASSKRDFMRRISISQIHKGNPIELMLGDRVVGFLPNEDL